MRNLRNGVTKEEVKGFIADLQANVGNWDKVAELIDNHELVVAYLETIGVNPDWLDRITVVEEAKRSMVSLLVEEGTVITEKGIDGKYGSLGIEDDKFYLYKGKKCNGHIEYVSGLLRPEEGFGEDAIELYDDIGNGGYKYRSIIDGTGVVQRFYEENEKGKELFVVNRSKTDCIYTHKTLKRGFGRFFRKTKEDTYADTVGYEMYVVPGRELIDNMKRYPKYQKWMEDRGITIDKVTEDVLGRITELGIEFSDAEKDTFEMGERIWNKRKIIEDTYKDIKEQGLEDKFKETIIKLYGKDKKKMKEIEYALGMRFHEVSVMFMEELYKPEFSSMDELHAVAERKVEERIAQGKIDVRTMTDEQRRYYVAVEALNLAESYKRHVEYADDCEGLNKELDVEMGVLDEVMPIIGGPKYEVKYTEPVVEDEIR